MSGFVPLSRRERGEGPDGPYEGVPDHLISLLIEWMDGIVGYRAAIALQSMNTVRSVLTRIRYVVQPGADDYRIFMKLRNDLVEDRELALDVVDALLATPAVNHNSRQLLEVHLSNAGSVWRVGEVGLQRRVDATAQIAASNAMTVADAASDELREAWAAAFGRNPDPSEAWNHAIKAVEEALKPVVLPTQPGGTLGGVVGTLRGQPQLFGMILQDNALQNTVDPVETFEDLLHYIWVNPDRHGGAHKRTPSVEEARAVVLLAVTVVEWARDGVIFKR